MRGEHNQRPFASDLIKAKDVHGAIIAFDFDVAIVGSVPLIHDFHDADPALVPRKACRSMNWMPASVAIRLSLIG